MGKSSASRLEPWSEASKVTMGEVKHTFRFFADGRKGGEPGRSISEVSLGSFRRGFRFPGAMARCVKGKERMRTFSNLPAVSADHTYTHETEHRV